MGRSVGPHPHKAGESGYTAFVQPPVSVGHGRTHGWRLVALRIGEARAQPETLTLRGFDQQSTQPSGVFALAGYMGHDAGLGIVVQFDLEQIVRTLASVGGIGTVQHQAFATGFNGFFELGL